LNPSLRQLLDPESKKWTAWAVFRAFGFLLLVPLLLIATLWSIIFDADWSRLESLLDKLFWFLIGLLGWGFQILRSLSGTEILLICILLALERIASNIAQLRETVSEWFDERRGEINVDLD
jgi:hypothetical protein